MKFIYHCKHCNRYKFDVDWIPFGRHGKAMVAQLTGTHIELVMIICEDCEQLIDIQRHSAR